MLVVDLLMMPDIFMTLENKLHLTQSTSPSQSWKFETVGPCCLCLLQVDLYVAQCQWFKSKQLYFRSSSWSNSQNDQRKMVGLGESGACGSMGIGSGCHLDIE